MAASGPSRGHARLRVGELKPSFVPSSFCERTLWAFADMIPVASSASSAALVRSLLVVACPSLPSAGFGSCLSSFELAVLSVRSGTVSTAGRCGAHFFFHSDLRSDEITR